MGGVDRANRERKFMENISVAQVKIVYSQAKDCCDGDTLFNQLLEVESHDGGGGHFFTVKTDRWAFGHPDQLLHLVNKVRNMVEVEDD